MFKNTYQHGLLSVFYSCGSNPLMLWDVEVHNGHIKRITDKEVNSIVLELISTNVATTYITCPKGNQSLGIKLPFLVMIVKNLKRYFSFEITVLDDKNMRRRFRISNFQSTTKIKPFCTTMPLALSHGWNQIQFNLADFTNRAYGSNFIETVRLQVHANVRVRRIYFCSKLYTEEELPQDYKLYLPLEKKPKKLKQYAVKSSKSREAKAVKSREIRAGSPEAEDAADDQEAPDEDSKAPQPEGTAIPEGEKEVTPGEATEAVPSKAGSEAGVASKTTSAEAVSASKAASAEKVPSKTSVEKAPSKTVSVENAPSKAASVTETPGEAAAEPEPEPAEEAEAVAPAETADAPPEAPPEAPDAEPAAEEAAKE